MTEKELRRLGKTDMLAIIRDQEAELRGMAGELEALRAKLEERSLVVDECGSLAEAALRLNGVFEAAQAAADQYLRGVEATAARGINAPRPEREAVR